MSLLGKPSWAERLQRLEDQGNAAQKAHADLLAAFNKFFDVVAKDLGYEAKTGYPEGYGYSFNLREIPLSPRQLAETVVPEQRTIKRAKTARCKK